MKKIPKYNIIFTVIFFLILLIIFYTLGDFKEAPIRTVTMIVLALLAINLPVIFPQWQMANAPLRKRRKRMLIILCIYIIFCIILSIILNQTLGTSPYQNKYVIMLWLVPIPFMFFNLFFPKDKEQKHTEDIETKINE